MASVKKVLVIGGGIAGMCAAIQLRKIGVAVDLIEVDKDWRVYGAGITLSGPTLRGFAEVGIIESIRRLGALTDNLEIYTSDGRKVAELPTPRVAGPDVPGAGGILRPVLAGILRDATLASGTAVRCGVTFKSIRQTTSGVEVVSSDGRKDTYDLAIGADGLFSTVRKTLFVDAPEPTYTGQASWRALVPRPAERRCAAMVMGGQVKVGVNPISSQQMYLFLTAPRDTPAPMDERVALETLRELLQEFGGFIGEIRDRLSEQSQVLYRPFYKILVPAPWHFGRVLLIGDAAHATTPHLASGAGIGVEDAVVLGQELAKESTVDHALAAFMVRRFERCRMVVENSMRLGDLEAKGGANAEHQSLMRESMSSLLAPI